MVYAAPWRPVSESALVRLVDRYFVGIVVLVAVLDVIGQAFDSWVQGRLASVYMWAGLGVLMILGTYALETVKSRGNPS